MINQLFPRVTHTKSKSRDKRPRSRNLPSINSSYSKFRPSSISRKKRGQRTASRSQNSSIQNLIQDRSLKQRKRIGLSRNIYSSQMDQRSVSGVKSPLNTATTADTTQINIEDSLMDITPKKNPNKPSKHQRSQSLGQKNMRNNKIFNKSNSDNSRELNNITFRRIDSRGSNDNKAKQSFFNETSIIPSNNAFTKLINNRYDPEMIKICMKLFVTDSQKTSKKYFASFCKLLISGFRDAKEIKNEASYLYRPKNFSIMSPPSIGKIPISIK